MSEWERKDEQRPRSALLIWLQVGTGVLLVPFLHLTVGLVMFGLVAAGTAAGEAGVMPTGPVELLATIGGMWLLGIGCTQGAYLLPAFIVAFLVRRPVAAGIAIGAALTLVLNGACYGVFCGIISQY